MNSLVRLAAFGAALAVCAFCSAQLQVSGGFEHVASYRSPWWQRPSLRARPLVRSAFTRAMSMTASPSMWSRSIRETAPRRVFHNPVPGEFGARNLAVAPNGEVYFGTQPRPPFTARYLPSHKANRFGAASARSTPSSQSDSRLPRQA